MIPRVEPDGMLFAKPVPTPLSKCGASFFPDHALASIRLRCRIIFFQQPGYSLRSRAPDDSSSFERGTAMVLRYSLFLLAAYIVSHKVFPFSALGSRVGDLEVGDFLLIIFRVLAGTIGAFYLVLKSFKHPDLQDRDRVWCKRWIAFASGCITLIAGSISIALLEKKGISLAMAHWIARGILWLLF
jgi:hypothetical protein